MHLWFCGYVFDVYSEAEECARPGMTHVWFLVGAGILSGMVVHAPSAHSYTPPYYW